MNIIRIFSLLISLSGAVYVNGMWDKGKGKVKNAVTFFRQQWAVLNTFDEYYNRVTTNEWFIKKFEPVGVEFAYRYHLLFINDEEFKSTVEYWELRNYYSYLYSIGLINPTKEQVFANFYITYLSFFMALEFRICSIVLYRVNPKDHESQINVCNKLANYLYIFAFTGFEKKLEDFERVLKDEPELRDKSKYQKIIFYLKSTRNEKPDVKKMSTMEKVVHYFKDYNLSFIMDRRFLRKMSKIFADINLETISSPATNEEGESEIPSFLLTGLQFTAQIKKKGKNTDEIAKNYYNDLWKSIKNSFPQLGLIRTYFQNVFTGERNKILLDFNSFVPDYKVARRIWSNSDYFYYFLKRLPSYEPSAIHSIKIIPEKIFRSNVVQIIRMVLQIKTSNYIKKYSKKYSLTADDKLLTNFRLSERENEERQKNYGHFAVFDEVSFHESAESSTAVEGTGSETRDKNSGGSQETTEVKKSEKSLETISE